MPTRLCRLEVGQIRELLFNRCRAVVHAATVHPIRGASRHRCIATLVINLGAEAVEGSDRAW